MKRLLVSTTALVSIVASSAFADASKFDLKMNGMVNFEYGVRNQKSVYKKTQNLSANQKNSSFQNTARASVSATAKADAGYTYGAVVGLMTSANQRNGKDSSNTDNTYIFLDSSLGRFEVGSNYSASKTMSISGTSVARATGGTGGDWDSYVTWKYVDPTTEANNYDFKEESNFVNVITKTNSSFYTSTGLIGDTYGAGPNNSESTNKITYYTPRVAGFQLGVSYTPDTDTNGSHQSYSSQHSGTRTLKNVVHGGLTYNNTFDQITLGVSAIGSTGSYKKITGDTTNHNYQGYAFGSSLSYAGFSASGNWGTMSKKFFTYDSAKNTGGIGDAAVSKAPQFWSAGVAYVQGPFGVSATYYNSKNASKNKFNAWSLSADYSLAPGITPYVEFTQFTAKANTSIVASSSVNGGAPVPSVKNRGNVFLVGTGLTF